ncbi:MAG: hypothetical protein NTY90_02355 [Candidatus Micrarchaeota archaeon]|nr:hypothetical protein [Candidatus Micrarchaeota archaeon]
MRGASRLSWWKMNGAIKAIVFILLLSFSVAASTVSFSQESKRTCGEQAEFQGHVKNALQSPQSFTFEVTDPSGWFTYYITPAVRANAGETIDFVFLATPSPATPPGEYNLFVTVHGSSGEELSASAWITVRDCTQLVLIVSGPQSVCAGNSFPLSLTVESHGQETAYGTVSLDTQASFTGPASFVIAAGESRKFTALATFPLGQAPGAVEVTASAATARGKTTAATPVNVRDCTNTAQATVQTGGSPEQQPGALSGFFTAATDSSLIVLILLVLVAAYLVARRRVPQQGETVSEKGPEPSQPRKKPIYPAPTKLKEIPVPELPALPDVLRVGSLGLMGRGLKKTLFRRAKKIQAKIRKAVRAAR